MLSREDLSYLIATFLQKECHLQTSARHVRSFIKDTNDFLCKLRALPPFPEWAFLCTVGVVGVIHERSQHNDGLAALKKALDNREEKITSTEIPLELVVCLFKNNVSERNKRVFKQKQSKAPQQELKWRHLTLFFLWRA